MQLKKFISILTIGVLALSLKAVPARRVPFEVTQPDGSRLTLSIVGDEWFHYLALADGTAVALDSATGFYKPVMADALAEKMRLANVRRASTEERRTRRMNVVRRVAAKASATAEEDSSIGRRCLYEGEKRGLVILVNFSDKKFVSTREEVDSMFNQKGYSAHSSIGSVRDYFNDQSYGRFTISFDVVGPFELENGYAYYGKNDKDDNDFRAHLMVAEALKAADDVVDFTQYVWNDNGEVDQVYVLYAGYGENAAYNDPNTVWPHEFSLSEAYLWFHTGEPEYSFDGVKVDTYACSCELAGASGSRVSGIGTACHEFSHCLGFPDTYCTNDEDVPDMMDWDLMSGGSYNGPNFNGEVPAGMTAYERWLCGWLDWNELTEEQYVRQMPCLGDEPQAYLWRNDGDASEAYILENRQNTRWFTYPYLAHGLLIYHLDYDEDSFDNNEVNVIPSHPGMSIVYANGVGGSTTTKYREHLWPGKSFNTSFTATTTPQAVWYNDDADGDSIPIMGITDIGESDGYISFRFCEIVADGISTMTLANDTTTPHGAILTLDGRRATPSDKGVVLMNGRKVIGRKN